MNLINWPKVYSLILAGFTIAVMNKTLADTGYYADAVFVNGEFKGLQISRD